MTALLLLLVAVAALAAYIRRVYAEFGKILTREIEENLDAWEEHIEPRLGLDRDHAALSASILEQLAIGLIALDLSAVLFLHPAQIDAPSPAEIAQAVLAFILIVVFACQFIPALLFNRTRGLWVVRILWPILLAFWIVWPVSAVISFFFSISALTEHSIDSDSDSTPDVDDLIEAGEEEGILEQSDRELVRSAVEFGDMLVRELMTPRPEIFAVPAETTLEEFLVLLREHNYSRVPVYAGTLDNITGIAFAHDLLQITDVDARTRTVASIQHPAVFVPETKRGYELLREMQRHKRHMCMVVDEYGAIAGVVTIENLLEEIVGDIRDEHEPDFQHEDPVREPSGAWLLPGSFPVSQLDEIAGAPVELEEDYEAATLGGLVSEIEGRIPLAGEVIVILEAGLRIEVVAATGHRVEKLRVFPTNSASDANPANSA